MHSERRKEAKKKEQEENRRAVTDNNGPFVRWSNSRNLQWMPLSAKLTVLLNLLSGRSGTTPIILSPKNGNLETFKNEDIAVEFSQTICRSQDIGHLSKKTNGSLTLGNTFDAIAF